MCEQAFKVERDQLLTARNKSLKNVENVVLIKDMYQHVATRGINIMVMRDDDSSDEEMDEDVQFHAARSFGGARPGLEFKLGDQGLGYYGTCTRPSRFKAAVLPGTEPRDPFGHCDPPEGVPDYISSVMINRCANIREHDWPSLVAMASTRFKYDERKRADGNRRRR